MGRLRFFSGSGVPFALRDARNSFVLKGLMRNGSPGDVGISERFGTSEAT